MKPGLRRMKALRQLLFLLSLLYSKACCWMVLPSRQPASFGNKFCAGCRHRCRVRRSRQRLRYAHLFPADDPRSTLQHSELRADVEADKSKQKDEIDREGFEAEVHHLMSIPTIDLKLELQMRGIEHRDAFEKIDLARRLATAKFCTSKSRPSSVNFGYHSTYHDASAEEQKASGSRIKDKLGSAQQSSFGVSVVDPNGDGVPSESFRDREDRSSEEDRSYSRFVERATRMSKPALVCELNALGISHSRLSDVSTLARQYARGMCVAQEEARGGQSLQGAEEAQHRLEEGRPLAFGTSELQTRLRKLGVEFAANASNSELATLVVNATGMGARDIHAPSIGCDDVSTASEIRSHDSAESSLDGTCAGNDRCGDSLEDVDGRTKMRRRAQKLSADQGSDKELQIPIREMSSRELMKALDELSVYYEPLAPRRQLQHALATAYQREGSRVTDECDTLRGDLGSNEVLMPLKPYKVDRDKPLERSREPGSFGTYHSALRWARQLTFDDVVEELRYRGVTFSPDADFSYLTRVLADEVLADEELMQSEEDTMDDQQAPDYGQVWETVMAMSKKNICRDLQDCTTSFDPRSPKEDLAELLTKARVDRQRSLLRGNGSGMPEIDQRNSGRKSDVSTVGGGHKTVPEGGIRRRTRGYPLLELGESAAEDSGRDGLRELETAVREAGGTAVSVAQEAATMIGNAAKTLLPDMFSFEDYDESADNPSAAGRRRRRTGRGAAGYRVGRVRRGASAFLQSSANRAGTAVARSAANGIVRLAEAAAEWAGGGVVPREHVLLLVAGFCLVFKRGLGSSLALLVVIRAGRVTVQRLTSSGIRGRSPPQWVANSASTGAHTANGPTVQRPKATGRRKPDRATTEGRTPSNKAGGKPSSKSPLNVDKSRRRRLKKVSHRSEPENNASASDW